MGKSKTETYLGFCIRAQKVIFGVDNIENKRKGVCLLLADEALGRSSFQAMVKAKEKFGCSLYLASEGTLSQWTHRPAVKAVAITDHNLASAIISVAESEPQLKNYSGGNN